LNKEYISKGGEYHVRERIRWPKLGQNHAKLKKLMGCFKLCTREKRKKGYFNRA
jgi:hypothetical protein